MKLNLAKVVKPLDLGGYAESYKGQAVQVCVNPDLATLRKRELLIEKYNRMLDALAKPPQVTDKNKKQVAEQVSKQLDAFNEYALGDFINGINQWFAYIWSQSADPATHWTVAELQELNEQDPALYQWLKNQTMEMISSHRIREKKD